MYLNYTTYKFNLLGQKGANSMEEIKENKELKPKSFRITTETHEKFKEIANTIGGNQQLALERLIQVYELEQSKTVLTGKAESIEQFQQYATKLVSLYTESMEYQQNQADLIREEFKRELTSKDEIIIQLQAEIKDLKIAEEVATESCVELDAKNKDLKKNLEQMERQHATDVSNLQQMLQEKDNLNKALVENIGTLKEKVEKFGEVQKQLDEMENLKKQLETLQTELDKKELEHEKALIELERKHNAELAKQAKKYATDIREYQMMFLKKQEENTEE